MNSSRVLNSHRALGTILAFGLVMCSALKHTNKQDDSICAFCNTLLTKGMAESEEINRLKQRHPNRPYLEI